MKLSLTILIALLFAWQQAAVGTPQADRQNQNVAERGKDMPLGFIRPPGWSVIRHVSNEEMDRFTCPSDIEHVASNDPNDWIMARGEAGVKAERLAAPNEPSYHMCSDDGRYMFFIVQHFMVRPPNPPYRLYALNRRTLKLELLQRSDTLVSINRFQPLSPLGHYLIGPPDAPRSVNLPDGQKVTVISVSRDTPGSTPKYDISAWAPDDSRLVLSSAAQLTVIDPSTGEAMANTIGSASDIVLRSLRVEGSHLYVLADRQLPGGSSEYEVYEYLIDGLKLLDKRELMREPMSTDRLEFGDGGIILVRRQVGKKLVFTPGAEFPEEVVAKGAREITYLHYPDGHEDPIFSTPYHAAVGGVGGCWFTESGKYVACNVSRQRGSRDVLLVRREAGQEGR